MMPNQRPLLLIGALCAAMLSLTACSGDPSGRERTAPQVGYVTVAASAVPIAAELGGRTVAYESSEVRPQVNGLIRKRLFTEGSVVRAGQPLADQAWKSTRLNSCHYCASRMPSSD